MREMLHAFVAAVIIAAAVVFTLGQLSDADHAVDRLGQDERGVIQPVSGDTGTGNGHSSVR